MKPLTLSNKSTQDTRSEKDKYTIPIDIVEAQLGKLKTNKAGGPDNIPGWLLKGVATQLAKPGTSVSGRVQYL